MSIIQLLLLGTLSCVVNIRCQPFTPSKTNNYIAAEIEVNEKGDATIGDGNLGNVFAQEKIVQKIV